MWLDVVGDFGTFVENDTQLLHSEYHKSVFLYKLFFSFYSILTLMLTKTTLW